MVVWKGEPILNEYSLTTNKPPLHGLPNGNSAIMKSGVQHCDAPGAQNPYLLTLKNYADHH